MYGLWPFLRRAAALLLLAQSVGPTVLAGPVDDQYALAAGSYGQQRYETAAKEFRQFIAEHPEHPLAASAQFFLAESLLQAGQTIEAAKQFTAFSVAQPQHRFAAQASFRVGEFAYLSGDYAAALPKLQAFVAAHASHPLCEYALPYLADAQLAQKDIKAAQANYQRALKAYPQGVLAAECRFGLARVAEEQGDAREASRFYEFVAERGSQPLANNAIIRLGRLLYREQDFATAIRRLEPLAESGEASDERATARYWLGHALARQGQHPRAQALWRQVADEDATHELAPAAALALAESYATQKDATSARKWCVRIGEKWASSSYADDALALQAQLALEAKDYSEVKAIAQSFEKQHGASPLKVAVQESLGSALLASGDFTGACAVYSPLAAQATPEQSHLVYGLALAQMGAKEYEAALATLAKIDEATAEDSVWAGALAARGGALVALARGSAALEPLQQYLARYADGPDAAQCRLQICIAHAQAKQFAQAHAAWKTLVQQGGDAALLPSTLYLAEAAAEAGEHSLAKEWFEHLAGEDQSPEVRERAVAGLAWLAQHAATPADGNAQLEDVLKKQPKGEQAAQISLRRAQNFEQQGEHDNALAAYLALAKEHPQGSQLPEALFGAARVHDQLHQDREALKLLETLLKEHADYTRRDAVLYQIAWVLLDLDRRDEAALYFSQLHDEHRASAYWSNATYRLADHRLRNKRYAEATGLLEELLAAAPDTELKCHALYLQGQAAASAQQWDQVGPPLERLIAEYPRHELRLLAEYWMAEADYRRGKLEQAGARLADLSTRLAGRNYDWLPMIPLRQAQILAHEQRWQEAHEVAATIAKKYPSFRQQYEVDYLLGRCLGAMAKFEAARAAYNRVIESSVGGRTETAAMAQWMIGETYFQQEKHSEAIAAYHRVERLFGFERWQSAALLQAGKCYEAQGDYRDAMQIYAQLIKQYAQSSYAAEASQRLRVAQQRANASPNRQE